LAHLIKQGDWKQVLVFTRTKHGANRLRKLVKDGIPLPRFTATKAKRRAPAPWRNLKTA